MEFKVISNTVEDANTINALLDEDNFVTAVTEPAAIAADCGPSGDASRLDLGAYAVFRIEWEAA